jgi:predicted permease
MPALMASNAGAADAFRSRDLSAPPRRRLHAVLVTAQVAGATALVVVAALFAESYLRAHAEDPGYPADRLVIARVDRASSPHFFLDARDRLGALPGVVAIGGITDFFIRRSGDQQVTIEGRAFADANGRLPKLVLDSVTPGYFQAMGIAIVDGRDFDDRDLVPGAAEAVIVSEAMARRFWPGESAVGKRLAGGSQPPADGRWSGVVGVVKDLRREQLDVAPVYSVFIPALLQRMDMTIRVATDAGALIPAIRRELKAIDPSLPLPAIVTASARLDETLAPRRFELQALVAFAAAGLFLSAAGLYASLAYQVTMRRREIGIRAALGADRPAIVRRFVGRGLALAAIGIAIGMTAALTAARVIQGLLYDTVAVNARSYLLAASAVLAVTIVAAWRPARDAARTNPMTVLRDG